jgi:hypothetical protein
MARRRRYRETGRGSFFGDLAYERVIERHREHFLVLLEQLFDWEAMSEQMIRLYKGRGEVGRPPYRPALVLKILFLSYLYDVSERSIVELADLHLLMKWFLGMAIDEAPPDHTTLSVFKKRFLEGSNWKVLEGMFDDMVGQARAHGLPLGELQVLDSVHTQADVNNDKDRERQEQGKEPRDPDDRTLNLPTQAYGGDKAYDDTDIYERLAVEGLDTAIALNDYRTAKKDATHARWHELVADPLYQERKKQRFRVEQPYGIAKRWHGFERCRYLGLVRYRIQALLTFMVVNAKRLVKLLTGVTFRAQAKGRRAEHLKPVLGTIP